MNHPNSNPVHPVLLGSALGDAWGGPGEFLSHEKLLQKRWNKIPDTLRITDDTQMNIYTISALQNITKTDIFNVLDSEKARTRIRLAFMKAYLKFKDDPDNTRAPGMTVMSSLKVLSVKTKLTGQEISMNTSKGNGTIMRSGWLGLLDLPTPIIVALAALQSQVTHGHKLATVSASIMPILIKMLQAGQTQPYDLWDTLKHVVNSDEFKEGLQWLNFNHNGIKELITIIQESNNKIVAFRKSDITDDPNFFFGEGWVAEEALINAVAVVATHPDNYFEGVRRLVCSTGDSDSTAALAGALYGASKVTVPETFSLLEPRYQKELQETSNWLDNPKYLPSYGKFVNQRLRRR